MTSTETIETKAGARGRRLARLAVIAHLLVLVLLSPASAGQPPALRRGINVGDYLAYPQSSDWPIFRGPRAATTDDELRRLATAGFDFVRLPVEPSPFLDRSPGETEAMEQRLVSFIRRITAAGMKVMVSGWARHETTPRWRAEQILDSRGNPELSAYLDFLKRIIVLLRDVPKDQWVLQPMNEPQSACRRADGPDWTVVQRDIYRDLRAFAPNLTLVLTSGCWSKIEALGHLDLTGYDTNTLVDLHYYDPYTFTHQSATWSADWIKHLAGVSFPPSRTNRQAAIDASARLFTMRRAAGGERAFAETLRKIDVYLKEDFGPARIAKDFATVRIWSDRQGIAPTRIVIGEFGAYRPPPEAGADDDGSRNRWLETVRKAAEGQGFGWALYAYHSDFGLVRDETTAAWDDSMLPALGLRMP